MNSLEGRIAVVTGGTQGLGATIARLFARNGAAGIVICGRNAANGNAIAQSISDKSGIPVHFVEADLGDVEDARKVIAAADEKFGKLDILVNAAAVTDRGTILDTSPELFDTMFAVNVRGPFFLIQEACKVMIREKTEGSIINIGSISATTGQPFITAYCASKGALATLTRNAAFAVMRNRIRINQLNIGWMSTEGEDKIQRKYHDADDNWLEDAAANQPFGRLVDPQEVARAVAFLASNDSGLMTGSVIDFDQTVVGGTHGPMPTPESPLTLD